MFRRIPIAVSQFCLALMLVVAAATLAQAAGPLSFDVTRCAVGPSRGGVQVLAFNYYVNNISQFEYITKINWMEVEVTAQRPGGQVTKHKFRTTVNRVINPPLAPRRRIQFSHKFSVRTGSSPFTRIAVRVSRWNYSHTR